MGRQLLRDGLKQRVSAARKKQLELARTRKTCNQHNKENSTQTIGAIPLKLPRGSSDKVKVLKAALTESHQTQLETERKLQEAEEHLSHTRERAEHFKKLLRLERQNARRTKDRLLM